MIRTIWARRWSTAQGAARAVEAFWLGDVANHPTTVKVGQFLYSVSVIQKRRVVYPLKYRDAILSTVRIPEQGQIITVRQRRYVVTDVLLRALLPSPLYGRAELQHLISLDSIEDDGLSESLQAIWELGPGAQISETTKLPEPVGFDPPERLEAFLDTVRLGAIASADMRALQATFRSGIEMEDYQLDPLARTYVNFGVFQQSNYEVEEQQLMPDYVARHVCRITVYDLLADVIDQVV